MNNTLVAEPIDKLPDVGHLKSGKFENTEPVVTGNIWDTLRIAVRFFTEKKVDPVPATELPVNKLTRESLMALPDDQLHVIKLGHSSVLLKVTGEFWLIDPVFSERASPFSFMGPKRFHQTPIAIDDLPPIDKVLISHDHYDHLDKGSVKKLAEKSRLFLVPLGVEAHLIKWGVDARKIVRFDWWQEMQDGPNMIAFTPTRHFSGRGLSDGNKSLWGSWVIDSPAGRVFFSGDSGYFAGFAEIGEKYGPFDATFIETGAYDPDWPDIHMTPEQSVQAHMDLKGKVMFPIHNGTFDLAFHAWYEPLERVLEAAVSNGVKLSTPVVGDILNLQESLVEHRWWQSLAGFSLEPAQI